jgi:flagellar M-ring protein FliF
MAEASLIPALGPIDIVSLIQAAVLALVALILGLFVIRPLMMATTRTAQIVEQNSATLALPSAGADDEKAIAHPPRVLTGEIDDQDLSDRPMVSFGADEGVANRDPMVRLRRLIDERQSETVEILRGWMDADEEEKV